MSWEKVKLQKIIHKPISGEWGNEGNSIKIIRTTNFTNNGRLNLHEVVTRDIALTKVNKKKLVKGDTIIEKSGGSPTQPVGRVVYFNEDDLYLCNNFTSVIRPKENVNGKYLFWFLFNNHISKRTLKYQNKTTGIINLKLENYINEVEIPLPPLPTQEKIAAILDKADALRRKDQELQKKYDELAQAIFIDMFGDPVKNEKGWEVKRLDEVCMKILGGGTPSKSNDSFYINGTIPWVTPKDMKREIIDSSIDYITSEAIDKSSVKLVPKNSLLMVIRSGILKRKLPIAINSKEVTINQDMKAFLFKKEVKLYFMMYFFYSIESTLLSKVRAVTADNIEFSEIRKIGVIIPPLDLQEAFAKKIELINQLKAQVNAERSEELFQSLLQQAFKGDIML